jgi:hypothetical protein
LRFRELLAVRLVKVTAQVEDLAIHNETKETP